MCNHYADIHNGNRWPYVQKRAFHPEINYSGMDLERLNSREIKREKGGEC